MKLVTGIEAIQSGKRWRHRDIDHGRWRSVGEYIANLRSSDLLRHEFIIEEEPREFWINILAGQVYTELPFNIDISDGNWIRVREVEK